MTPKEFKKVSVILPNYNYAKYFSKRVDGILAQTYPIYELIILDDASTDSSLTVMKEKLLKLSNAYPDLKIKAKVNKENSGSVFRQWLKGIELAEGDYIWICELDDEVKPNFLETAMNGFKNPKTILSYTNSKIINDKNRPDLKSALRKPLNFVREDRPARDYTRDGREELSRALSVYNTIPNVSAVVFKKDPNIDFKKILNAASKFQVAGDWYFYSELLLNGRIAYFKKPLNIHRVHKSSVTEKTKKERLFQEIQFMHQKIKSDVKLSPNAKNKIKAQEKRLRKAWKIPEEISVETPDTMV
ncbi:glycosyltransferase [Candidatus Saccharibacteria bacterium]|nr:glycosyltransferase [Candidatus Saccharibacteria bacterium]